MSNALKNAVVGELVAVDDRPQDVGGQLVGLHIDRPGFEGEAGNQLMSIEPKPGANPVADMALGKQREDLVEREPQIIYLVDGEQVRLTTRRQLAQELYGSLAEDDGRNFTDELSTERQAEARREKP